MGVFDQPSRGWRQCRLLTDPRPYLYRKKRDKEAGEDNDSGKTNNLGRLLLQPQRIIVNALWNSQTDVVLLPVQKQQLLTVLSEYTKSEIKVIAIYLDSCNWSGRTVPKIMETMKRKDFVQEWLTLSPTFISFIKFLAS